ncbi:MAG: DNA alkylation repair protein [Acidobacteria bacterium]|nr:DNA alkylation repair protein [Acidobacteriota bacterium]
MAVLKPETLATEIREYCAAHADAAGAAKYARYFKEGYDAWGLMDGKHEFWHAKQEEWLKRYSKLGLKGFLRAGELLFRSGKYEEGGLAIRFVKSFGAEVDATALAGLQKWFAAGIGNWAHVDVLCAEVLGPALGGGRVTLKDLAEWRESKLRFQRRAVPVAMLNLLKSKFKTGELLKFVRPMMMDQERVVQQGLGWFLRELWKKDRAPVEAFLLEWKETAPRLIFQYATEKMTTEEKARFKRAGKRG